MSRLQEVTFSKYYHDYLIQFFDPRLDSFVEYVEFAEKSFQKEKRKTDRARRVTRKKLKTGEIPAEFHEDVTWSHQEEYNLSASFNDILINSLAIQLFTVLEVELKKFCDEWAEDSKTEYKLSDIKGEHVIDRAKIYLSKSLKVKKALSSKEWEFIQDYRIVRNALVHSEGLIAKNQYEKFKAKSLVRKGKIALYKRTDNQYQISIVDSKFLKDAATTIYNLLTQLVDEVQ